MRGSAVSAVCVRAGELTGDAVAEVFISYKREDRDMVAPLAQALERSGFSVWWDPQLETGEDFQTRINAQLETAKAVLVCWTPRSVQSEWVRAEAAQAREQNKLVPVILETAKIPVPFNTVQARDFTRSRPLEPDHKRFERVTGEVVRDVQKRVGGEEVGQNGLPKGDDPVASSQSLAELTERLESIQFPMPVCLFPYLWPSYRVGFELFNTFSILFRAFVYHGPEANARKDDLQEDYRNWLAWASKAASQLEVERGPLKLPGARWQIPSFAIMWAGCTFGFVNGTFAGEFGWLENMSILAGLMMVWFFIKMFQSIETQFTVRGGGALVTLFALFDATSEEFKLGPVQKAAHLGRERELSEDEFRLLLSDWGGKSEQALQTYRNHLNLGSFFTRGSVELRAVPTIAGLVEGLNTNIDLGLRWLRFDSARAPGVIRVGDRSIKAAEVIAWRITKTGFLSIVADVVVNMFLGALLGALGVTLVIGGAFTISMNAYLGWAIALLGVSVLVGGLIYLGAHFLEGGRALWDYLFTDFHGSRLQVRSKKSGWRTVLRRSWQNNGKQDLLNARRIIEEMVHVARSGR